MSETKSMESARDLLSLWFKEEFAKGRCDAWERFFREDLRVTTATGEEVLPRRPAGDDGDGRGTFDPC